MEHGNSTAKQPEGRKGSPLHRNGRALRRAAHGITFPRRASCPPRRASEAPRRDFFYQRRKSRATMKSKLAQFGKRIYARRHGRSSFSLIFAFHGFLWLGIPTVADFMKGVPSRGCHDRGLSWSIPPFFVFASRFPRAVFFSPLPIVYTEEGGGGVQQSFDIKDFDSQPAGSHGAPLFVGPQPVPFSDL